MRRTIAAALLPGKQPVEQRSAGVANVDLACGRRSKAHANGWVGSHQKMLAGSWLGRSSSELAEFLAPAFSVSSFLSDALRADVGPGDAVVPAELVFIEQAPRVAHPDDKRRTWRRLWRASGECAVSTGFAIETAQLQTGQAQAERGAAINERQEMVARPKKPRRARRRLASICVVGDDGRSDRLKDLRKYYHASNDDDGIESGRDGAAGKRSRLQAAPQTRWA